MVEDEIMSYDDFLIKRKNEIPHAGSTDRQLQNIIREIIQTKTRYSLTPEQNRYIDNQVRSRMNLRISKRPKRLPDYLNPSEIFIYKKNALNKSLSHSLLSNILIFTGLRISEARNLDIRDIDFQNNQLKVVQGKGHKDRYVPVGSGLLEQIKQYTVGRDKGYIFINNKGTPYSIRRLQQMMEEVIKECNFNKKLSTHSLRHTYACLCLSKGLRLEDIKLLMGHSSIKTTEIYAKLELSTIKTQYLQIIGEI